MLENSNVRKDGFRTSIGVEIDIDGLKIPTERKVPRATDFVSRVGEDASESSRPWSHEGIAIMAREVYPIDVTNQKFQSKDNTTKSRNPWKDDGGFTGSITELQWIAPIKDGTESTIGFNGEVVDFVELCSFIDGPPFTLQRLCEILLDARSVYSNLSKLALALEKNLLVTSSLTICMDPYPSPPYDKLGKGSLESLPISTSPTQGGVEAMEVADEDEEMTDAEKMDEDNKNESKEDSVDNGNNSESKEFVDDADKKNHKAKYEADKKEEGSVDEVNKESVDEAEKEKNKESASTPIPGNTTSAISETSSGQSTSSNEISKDDPSPSSDDLHYTSL
ncbi:hypothetical protein GIB67_013283 [Kingdonia uniflora]|uniref:Serine/threonine-protein phosphatase 4 regulatory subunit 2 n=1 Tax=Kingdonia uniflora TaxID=39325 RepID=A0A7J7N621_9MAGN|nr:hypothetical protein GIB67_013283 [Kingdonia uniflora]